MKIPFGKRKQRKEAMLPPDAAPDLVGRTARIVEAVNCSRGTMEVDNRWYSCHCYGKILKEGTIVRVKRNDRGHGYAVEEDKIADSSFSNSGEPYLS